MMALGSLLGKDAREHGASALLLLGGTLVMVMLALARNQSADYSMSPFEIVRFALLSFVPVVTLIVGERLIVREFLAGTRLFVESLPLGRGLPLLVKYLLGFGYLLTTVLLIIAVARLMSSRADGADIDYLLLLLGKSVAIVALYWSVVFCFSLCGYLRMGLYLVLAGIAGAIAWIPGIDETRIPPFELLDAQLFVFERVAVPWFAVLGTVLLALLFAAAGFGLSRVGEGSVAERLARPMTRRDLVAVSVLGFGGLTIVSSLHEEAEQTSFEFSADTVLRHDDPRVSLLYLDEAHRAGSEVLFERLVESLAALQARTGLVSMPAVRLALDPTRESHDIDYSVFDSVFIETNWLEHDDYDDTVLETVVLHGVLSLASGSRADFEPYHWVLDGFTRWWAEQGDSTLKREHAEELFARAGFALQRIDGSVELIEQWQLLAEQFGYPTAEALAWSAMHFLEKTKGRDVVIALAQEFLIEPVGRNLAAVLVDRQESSSERFERVTALPWKSFQQQWLNWLSVQMRQSGVARRLAALPAVRGVVAVRREPTGAHQLLAGYRPLDKRDSTARSFSGSCRLRHALLGPFDHEMDVSDRDMLEAECELDPDLHRLDSRYAPGDRVFVVLEQESEVLHQALRLHAERIAIP